MEKSKLQVPSCALIKSNLLRKSLSMETTLSVSVSVPVSVSVSLRPWLVCGFVLYSSHSYSSARASVEGRR